VDLFDANPTGENRRQPLAARMRPRSLDQIVGQERILGPGKLLRRAIEADRLNSIILYGPPGSGKTSLASVIASATRRCFEQTSGVLANVAALRALIEQAEIRNRRDGQESILFIDEIHRFNKAQQDVLLPHVENGRITLIGATTHNPLFFINSPLTSRSLVFELDALSNEAIEQLLQRALDEDPEMGKRRVTVSDDALRHLAELSEGDARRALNALEIAVLSSSEDEESEVALDRHAVEDSIQKKVVLYDHDEEGHYDTISAFIKSVRGSDPHAAVYWLAKMLYAGEDPRFIARRLVILASEDIGNADPRGLTVATSAIEAVSFVGMPEARIILSQATTYLSTAPKSNAAYKAIEEAERDVKEGRSLPVPEHLKNVRIRTSGDPKDGADETYVYPHDYQGHHVAQEYVPTDRRYYVPDGQGYEETIVKRMKRWEAENEAQTPEKARK